MTPQPGRRPSADAGPASAGLDVTVAGPRTHAFRVSTEHGGNGWPLYVRRFVDLLGGG